jgi:methylmalonyl-CoA epimerase
MSATAGVLGFDHTALAVRSFERALPLYRELLGGVEIGRGQSPRFGLNWLELRYPNGSVLELVEPDGPHSTLHRFLDARGEGLHHLTFIVEDAQATAERLKASGYTVVDEHYGAERWKVAHLAPRSANGTVVQIAQGPDAVPPHVHVPDALRARARALLEDAPAAERGIVARVMGELGLLDAQPTGERE